MIISGEEDAKSTNGYQRFNRYSAEVGQWFSRNNWTTIIAFNAQGHQNLKDFKKSGMRDEDSPWALRKKYNFKSTSRSGAPVQGKLCSQLDFWLKYPAKAPRKLLIIFEGHGSTGERGRGHVTAEIDLSEEGEYKQKFEKLKSFTELAFYDRSCFGGHSVISWLSNVGCVLSDQTEQTIDYSDRETDDADETLNVLKQKPKDLSDFHQRLLKYRYSARCEFGNLRIPQISGFYPTEAIEIQSMMTELKDLYQNGVRGEFKDEAKTYFKLKRIFGSPLGKQEPNKLSLNYIDSLDSSAKKDLTSYELALYFYGLRTMQLQNKRLMDTIAITKEHSEKEMIKIDLTLPTAKIFANLKKTMPMAGNFIDQYYITKVLYRYFGQIGLLKSLDDKQWPNNLTIEILVAPHMDSVKKFPPKLDASFGTDIEIPGGLNDKAKKILHSWLMGEVATTSRLAFQTKEFVQGVTKKRPNYLKVISEIKSLNSKYDLNLLKIEREETVLFNAKNGPLMCEAQKRVVALEIPTLVGFPKKAQNSPTKPEHQQFLRCAKFSLKD